MNIESPFLAIGIADNLSAKNPRQCRSNVYFVNDDEWMYFDRDSGLLVGNYVDMQVMPDQSTRGKNVRVYIGPEGISETPDKTLGRFIQPIIDHIWLPWKRENLRPLILYDKKLRCFFKIDFQQKTVHKGPEIHSNGPYKSVPIQIGQLQKNKLSLSFYWDPPYVKVSDKDPNDIRLGNDFKPIIPRFYDPYAGPYLLVLDKTGRIDLLDRDTLEFDGTAGWLPAPETYFGTMPSVTPKDLSGYQVWPLNLNKFYLKDGKLLNMTFGEPYEPEQAASRMEREYLGMFVAGLSRDGTAMVLAVFDAQGKRIKTESTRLPIYEGQHTSYLRSSQVALWGTPWAPVSTIGKYLAENLHPPVLSVASYFTASTFEAAAGYRALFLLPNSFVAMVARDSQGNFVERLLYALLLISPSIILGILLAVRVVRDTNVVGLPGNIKLFWIIATACFGLAGYITYRLTRPKVTLVTCANCGKPRRPDADICHRCGSKWDVPELMPPAWRIVGDDITERASGYQEIR
jgi:hypothetical protein